MTTDIPEDIRNAAYEAWTSVPTADWESNATEIIALAILAERERCAELIREVIEHSHLPIGDDVEYLRKKHDEAMAKALSFLGIAMTEEQKTELRALIEKGREKASKVGPMHSIWDVIMDAEAVLNGRPQLGNVSVQGLINRLKLYAE